MEMKLPLTKSRHDELLDRVRHWGYLEGYMAFELFDELHRLACAIEVQSAALSERDMKLADLGERE